MNPFHLAITVHDLDLARQFYTGVLGCRTGRSDENWIDFDFFGHQLVCHLDKSRPQTPTAFNPVDGHKVPIPHFGIVLPMDAWNRLADSLQATDIEFVIAPYIRFAGLTGEQGTMFFHDPSGNAIEIKGFRDIDSQLFAT